MAQLTDAGIHELDPRQFFIESVTDGVTTPVDLTGIKVYLFKWKEGHDEDTGTSINTVDNLTELVITDAAGGEIWLYPLGTWWNDFGNFELLFGVDDAKFFWAPGANHHKITVVKRPTQP